MYRRIDNRCRRVWPGPKTVTFLRDPSQKHGNENLWTGVILSTGDTAAGNMELVLKSQRFSFEEGDSCIVSANWEAELKQGQEAPQPVRLEKDHIRNAPVTRIGTYFLVLGGLSVIRLADRRRFFVPAFFAPEAVTITDSDLENGTALLSLEPDGPYSLTLFDTLEHRPIVNQTLSLFVDPWHGLGNQPSRLATSLRVSTDDAGTVVFLDQPTLCRIKIGPGMGFTVIRL